MLKIQMLEQIVTNENVIDDDDQRHGGSGGAGGRTAALSPGGQLAAGSSTPGSVNLSPIASKSSSSAGGADDETRSLNRSSRLSPQGQCDITTMVECTGGGRCRLWHETRTERGRH
uniref:Uncharacterized protein n=1 Tax=Anopheles farauti TaxID=69004 RepID=A0A182QY11_9DIPT